MWDVRSAFYGINFKFLRTQFPDFHAYREQKKINTQDATFICCLLLFFFSLTLCKTKQGALGSQNSLMMLTAYSHPTMKIQVGSCHQNNYCGTIINQKLVMSYSRHTFPKLKTSSLFLGRNYFFFNEIHFSFCVTPLLDFPTALFLNMA